MVRSLLYKTPNANYFVKTPGLRGGAMNETKRLWILLGAVIFSTLFVLGWFGRELYRKVPPIPLEVRIETGERLMTKADILRGQQAWQSIGLVTGWSYQKSDFEQKRQLDSMAKKQPA